jgi:DNA-binding response OmpR family regulator
LIAMKILVVEDEPDIAEDLAWGLQAEGYVVDVADNGVDGLWKARNGAYDVIILDVMLPGLDGYQVAKALREGRVWTPVLMLTAMDDELDHAEGLDSGADSYLAKPFSYPVLLANLRSLTRRSLGARPAVLTAAGLALDPATRTVIRDGVALEMSSRDVSVLEYLLRRAGRVVSRNELLEHCWDMAYDGPVSAVDVQIHRLRRKIETPGAAPLIETVRGQGYVIRDGAAS